MFWRKYKTFTLGDKELKVNTRQADAFLDLLDTLLVRLVFDGTPYKIESAKHTVNLYVDKKYILSDWGKIAGINVQATYSEHYRLEVTHRDGIVVHVCLFSKHHGDDYPMESSASFLFHNFAKPLRKLQDKIWPTVTRDVFY